MATTKPPVPPVNLKDRIAALQQRSVSPTSHASAEPGSIALAPTPSGGGGGRVSSLKDKIANFERKGAVPTPRGRFGTGAPPVGDSSTKKKGELYGNRVPELAKPTGEAALETRKRTISTSGPTRPEISGDVPPVPTLADNGASLSGTPGARRIVSDVGPRTKATLDAEPSEKKAAEEAAPVSMQDNVAPTASPEPASNAAGSMEADETPKSETANAVPSPSVIDVQPSPLVVEEPVVVAEEKPAVAQEAASTSAEPLAVNTELDNSSMLGDTTASSESVPTPSTSASFASPTSTIDDAKRMFVRDLPRMSISSMSPPATPEAISPISASLGRNSLAIRQSVISEMSVGSALEAKIVSEPLKVVSPTITRATIIPAPTLPSAPSPPPVAATEDAVLASKPIQKSSFTAVVHRKVRESSALEAAPSVSAPAPAPAPPKPSYPPPRTPAVQRVRATIPEEPSSPGFSDLVSLMADAALLEEALSSSPARKQAPTSASAPAPAPAPTVNVEPVVPEVPEPSPPVPAFAESIVKAQPDVFATPQPLSPPPAYTPFTPDMSHFASGSSQQPSTHVRSRTTPAQEPPAAQKEVHRFSSLRERKQSIPASVYSQAESTESSVFVSRPSSPPGGFRDNDASSVRSSSKSWKSSKKGIGRASSWFFKGKNKSNPSLEEQGARQGVSEVPSLLLPTPPVPPLPTQMLPPNARPTSMLSVASVGSPDGAFDLSAFPSVPGAAAAVRPQSMQYPNIAEYANPQQAHAPARPHTMYAPARK